MGECKGGYMGEGEGKFCGCCCCSPVHRRIALVHTDPGTASERGCKTTPPYATLTTPLHLKSRLLVRTQACENPHPGS